MKILELRIDNFLRVEAAEIRPDGTMVVIAGPNGAGKSSVINALWSALGGGSFKAEQPIHSGAERAKIEVQMTDGETVIVVERTYTAKGSRLVVSEKKGDRLMTFRSPQALLDGMVGALTFDPLAFIHQTPAAQASLLAEIAGLDVSDLDAAHEALMVERRDIGRDLRAKGDAPAPEGERPDRKPIGDLVQEREDNQARREQKIRAEQTWRDRTREKSECESIIARLDAELAQLNRQRRAAVDELDVLAGQETEAREQFDAFGDLDATEETLRNALEEAQAHNRGVDEWETAAAAASERDALQQRYEDKTREITENRDARTSRIAETALPVEGLTLREDEGSAALGVLWDGLPLSQASAAAKLRVGMAVGMARNPTLRIVRIEHGSLLDRESMATLEALAAEKDFQVWIERVADEDSGVGIYIEDGRLAARPEDAQESLFTE